MKCLEFFKMSGKKLFTSKERNVWKNNEMSGIFLNVWKKAIYLERKKMFGKIMKCLEFFKMPGKKTIYLERKKCLEKIKMYKRMNYYNGHIHYP